MFTYLVAPENAKEKSFVIGITINDNKLTLYMKDGLPYNYSPTTERYNSCLFNYYQLPQYHKNHLTIDSPEGDELKTIHEKFHSDVIKETNVPHTHYVYYEYIDTKTKHIKKLTVNRVKDLLDSLAICERNVINKDAQLALNHNTRKDIAHKFKTYLENNRKEAYSNSNSYNHANFFPSIERHHQCLAQNLIACEQPVVLTPANVNFPKLDL